ncbi:MAG: glycoside hydrolase family 66 protein [Clostridiales bacterium]|nr:glycoside hydrolase family 66 protein [Clostridiales bacterium]
MVSGFCKPDKAQYLVGEQVRLSIPNGLPAVLTLSKLHQQFVAPVAFESSAESFSALVSGLPTGSYGVSFERSGERYETAFDVVESRSSSIRYGFLTSFSPGSDNPVPQMAQLHLNAIQFYDWMYRHDNFVADTEIYKDGLGKETSLASIQEKIKSAKDHGMRPFAYGAVYASSKEGWERHPEWGLYTLDKEPMLFGNWLYFMNISSLCGWHEHILEEFRKASLIGFMGIHMDTYGFPKRAWDASGHPLELSSLFAPLVNKAAQTLKEIDPENGVIFNAVNNWPIQGVANTSQDSIYIEVWPPHESYIDLYHLIREAKLLSGKPVALAAYMEPFKNAKTAQELESAEWSYLLANAAICASGGTQLALGENGCILCDSYYVNHAKLRDSFLPSVQRYADFLVRYAPLLYDDRGMDTSMTSAGGINEDFIFSSPSASFSANAQPGAVWAIIRESDKRVTIQLINLTGNSDKWNAPKNAPNPVSGIRLQMRLDRKLSGIYAASPDKDTLSASSLGFTFESTGAGRIYSVLLPSVTVWTSVWIEID